MDDNAEGTDSCLVDKKILHIQGNVITFIVGQSKTPFVVHDSFIGAASEVFRLFLSEEKAPQERQINLFDCEASTFELYVQWLYTATLPLLDQEKDKWLDIELLRLLKAYELGECFLDGHFKDAVADAICDYLQHRFEKTAKRAKYDIFTLTWHITLHTKASRLLNDSTPLHRLWVDMCANFVNLAPGDHPVRERYPPWFFLGVERVREQKDRTQLRRACDYHCHGPDSPCYRSILNLREHPGIFSNKRARI